jgi:hypothetical protein
MAEVLCRIDTMRYSFSLCNDTHPESQRSDTEVSAPIVQRHRRFVLCFYASFVYLIVIPGTPFCAAVRAYSSVVELIEHVPDTVLPQLVYPG